MANKIYLGTVWVNGEKQAPVASYARIAGDDNVVPIIEVKDREDNGRTFNEAALWLNEEQKNLTLLSYSYCITGISKPVGYTE